MTDRTPGAPGQYTMIIDAAEFAKIASGEYGTVTLTRDDQPLVEGTPYNKEHVLPDDLAEKICPDVTDPSPADAFEGLLSKRYTVILGASSWSQNVQSITVPTVTADQSKTDVFASPDPQDENYEAYVDNGVRLYAQRDGSVVFKCEDVPKVNITVNIVVRV